MTLSSPGIASRANLHNPWAMHDEASKDRRALAALAAGDPSALGELYDRYGGVLLALGQRILGGAAEAEEVLHDVFVEIYKCAGAYDPERGSVKTWMILRMRSRCLDRVRSAWRSRRSEMSPAQPVELTEARDPSSEGGDGARLRAALAALPVAQREVLVLGYFEGLSSSEIAERLDVPIGTVKSRVAAALSKLRDHFVEVLGQAS
jgi:RNA polymerase sigma-70 factor (ECF subfamily)